MISISFSGMDGSGKSTQCQKIVRRFEELGAEVKSLHMGVRGEGETAGGRCLSFPIANRANRSLRGLSGKGISRGIKLSAGLCFYVIDSWVTHFIHKIRYGDRLVIYDRHFYDFLVIFASNFPVIPWRIVYFAKILPRSDVTIIMEVNLETAEHRRPENTREKLQRYCWLYQRLGKILDVKTIDGSKSLETVEVEINQRCYPVFKRFRNKMKQR